ncbi:hypothetical protein N7471_010595 [Penicillium samsonianum]|uniref:uncharacterized protein n=1 Tax=Penicillium samsonianum TaxID=1882272 RepID=UPI002547B6F4|nr:uncharacterized protein N7471_010595 [Penicillium samsonianum]KAJ6126102.1 hypothetical protein N7471_010595 [Penicillium samsonianum]
MIQSGLPPWRRCGPLALNPSAVQRQPLRRSYQSVERGEQNRRPILGLQFAQFPILLNLGIVDTSKEDVILRRRV